MTACDGFSSPHKDENSKGFADKALVLHAVERLVRATLHAGRTRLRHGFWLGVEVVSSIEISSAKVQ
jgi:hypothetical protein